MEINQDLIIQTFSVSILLAISLIFLFIGLIVLVARFVRARNSKDSKEKIYVDILISSIFTLLLIYFVFNNKNYFSSWQVFKPILLTFIMSFISTFFIIYLIVTPIMFGVRRIKKNM